MHLPEALFLKAVITYRKDFVHEQDLSLQMRCDRECEPEVHAS